jgi:hypothetical protein
LQLLFRVIEDLAGVVSVSERMADIARDNGGVVEVVEKATAMFGEDDLLLSTLDGGCEV